MTLPISYFRFYFPEYVLKTRLPPNCATGFLDSLRGLSDTALSSHTWDSVIKNNALSWEIMDHDLSHADLIEIVKTAFPYQLISDD